MCSVLIWKQTGWIYFSIANIIRTVHLKKFFRNYEVHHKNCLYSEEEIGTEYYIAVKIKSMFNNAVAKNSLVQILSIRWQDIFKSAL